MRGVIIFRYTFPKIFRLISFWRKCRLRGARLKSYACMPAPILNSHGMNNTLLGPATPLHSCNTLPPVTVCQYGIRATLERSATWLTFNVWLENSVGLKSFEKSSRQLQFKQCLRKKQNQIVTMWKLYLFMFVSHRDNQWTVWGRRVKVGIEIHHNYEYKLCAKLC